MVFTQTTKEHPVLYAAQGYALSGPPAFQARGYSDAPRGLHGLSSERFENAATLLTLSLAIGRKASSRLIHVPGQWESPDCCYSESRRCKLDMASKRHEAASQLSIWMFLGISYDEPSACGQPRATLPGVSCVTTGR